MQKEQIIVTAAIIEKEGRYLITQRPEGGHLPLKWEFPGGRVKLGEDPKECLEREIKEELGINIHVFSIFDCSSFVYDNSRHIILLAFSCYMYPGKIKKIGIKDYKWVTLKTMTQYDFCEADIPIIKKLQEKEV